MSSNYILVHGAGEGNWIWDPVLEALNRHRSGFAVVHGSHLRSRGPVNMVVAKDLPGHGHRRHEHLASITLETYVEAVVSWIKEHRLRDVVLVGHAMAGLILPQVAARLQGRIKRLVFINAVVPDQSPGLIERLMFVNAFIPDQEKTVIGSLPLSRRGFFLLRSLVKMEDKRGVGLLHKTLAQLLLCNGMEPRAAGAIISRLTPYPFGPMATPVVNDGFGGIPCTYVVFTKDRLFPPSRQRQMAQNLVNPHVIEMVGGHLSGLVLRAPEIAHLLLEYA